MTMPAELLAKLLKAEARWSGSDPGVCPNEDRVSPPIPARFSLTMLTGTPAGDVHTFTEYQRMLRNAGYSSTELHPLPPTFFNVVIGEK